MVAPGSRAAITHCKDVPDNLADSGVGIAPDVVEDSESSDMDNPFCWNFPQEKVE